MHILYLHQFFMTRAGVGNTSCYEFSRYFVEQGARVTVITAPDPFLAPADRLLRRRWVDGIEVIEVKAGSADYMRANRLALPARLLRFATFAGASGLAALRVERPDVVLVTSPPLFDGLPAALAALFHRAPLVLELHDLWPEAPVQVGSLRNPLLIAAARRLERFLYGQSAHVAALSPGLRAGAVRAGVPAERTSVVPVGTDCDLFTPALDGGEVRARLGLGDRFVVSYFGAMGNANGLGEVIGAARILRARGERNVVFVLHGDGLLRPRLVEACRQYGLDNVVFSDPVADKSAVARLAAASDACLTFYANAASMQNASPAKLFDTFAAGRPALVNMEGWIRELVEEGKAGLFVRPDDPDDLADKVLRLRDQPELRRLFGSNARRLAENRFDRTRIAAAYLDTLQSLLPRAAHGRAA